MLLLDLPNEILLRIAWFVPKCSTCHCRHNSHDLVALSRCSRFLHSLITPQLTGTSNAMHMLLWAILHNRPDTATKAITHGADVRCCITEIHYIRRHTVYANHGTPLDIAVRHCLHPMQPAAHQLALDICAVILTAGENPGMQLLASIVDAGDTDLLRICLPHITDITDINAHTHPHGHTLLALATTAGHDAMVALLSAAGARMEGTGRYKPIVAPAGILVQAASNSSPRDFRVGYSGSDHSRTRSWNEWGPVCILPGPRPGCRCPWCPREITGGDTFLEVWQGDSGPVVR